MTTSKTMAVQRAGKVARSWYTISLKSAKDYRTLGRVAIGLTMTVVK
jgi:hypothetical protein